MYFMWRGTKTCVDPCMASVIANYPTLEDECMSLGEKGKL